MKRFLAFLESLDDRMNPIVVKELRQAVQSRLVVTILLLFLLINLLVVGGRLLTVDPSDTRQVSGEGVFLWLFGVLAFTCIVFVPLYVGGRLAFENSDANVDLLFITTIRAGAIIRGKFWAGMALAALIFSACMPFLACTYLLRGVDLPSVFFLLGAGLFYTAGAIVAGLFVGTLRGGWIVRGLLFLGLLSFLIWSATAAIGLSVALMGFGLAGDLGDASFWAATGTTAFGIAGGAGFFYVLAVVGMMPRSANRTLPIRLYLTALWLATGVLCWIWARHVSHYGPAMSWMIGGLIIACLGMLISVAERTSWSPRVTRTIPRNPLLRMPAFVFYCGAGGGVLWSCALAVLSVVLAFLLQPSTGPTTYPWGGPRYSDFVEGIAIAGGTFLYVFCYCMTAVLLCRLLLRNARGYLVSLLAILLMIAGGFLPILTAYMAAGEYGRLGLLPLGYLLPNPLALLVIEMDSYNARTFDVIYVFVFLAVWTSAVVLANMPWLFQQLNRFRRHVPAGPAGGVSGPENG